ncbi:MAG TPA: serine hydrolase domain-containing protein [Chthonomonadaceae bacterium]|nr:serine hydrolase domain-containing protein [Chthonomonadaceae bacterium]
MTLRKEGDCSLTMQLKELIKPPKALGFDPDHLQLAEALLQRGLADNLYSAAVAIVLRHGMIAAQTVLGQAQPAATPPIPTTLDTIFDMASVSKTVTAILLLQSVERGLLQLGQSVKSLLPEAENAPVGAVTLRQLATHTSGLPAWKALYQTKAPSALADILTTPLETEPGTKYTYSDLGYITLGEIVSRVNARPLDQLAHERIFAPLGMTRTGYNPAPELRSNIAATGHSRDREGQTNVGVVHDENAHGLGGVAGHAGVFSCAPDLVRYALALAYPASAAHFMLPPLLSVPTRHLAQRSQIANPAVGSHSIGWFTPPNGYLPRGDLLSDRAYGHTGFTGTLLLFDPEYDLSLILLTNRVISPSDGNAFLRLRWIYANIVAGALVG